MTTVYNKNGVEFDIDAIVTDLNGKADVDLTNCLKPHIVETYSNGDTWYRIYSDGWCEQGGSIIASTAPGATNYQITFIKPFVSKDAIKVLGGFPKAQHSSAFGQLWFQNGDVTNTTAIASIIAYANDGHVSHAICGGTLYWYAAGYIS